MKFGDLINLSLRNYVINPMRTFLTVLGVSVGIGTILFLVSLGYGIQKIILERITTSDSLLSLEVTPGASDVILLNKNVVEEIEKNPQIAEVSPLASFSGQMNHDKAIGDGLIYGVNPSYFRLSGIVTKQGKPFTDDSSNGAIVTLAGLSLLDLGEQEALGREISLTLFVPYKNEEGNEEIKIVEPEVKYIITGIIDNSDSNYIFVPLASLSGIAIGHYDSLQVKVANSADLESARQAIIEKGFLVSALSDIIDQANKIFNIIQIVLALFGLVALVVSAIGMFNTMTIALLERINEIGIMRAIGATKSDIRWLFLIESTIMGFLGGLGGVLVGFIVSQIFNVGLNLLAKSFGGQVVSLFYSPVWFVAFIIVFSTVIGLITGLYPSKKAARLNPLDALRYK
jgi:putative ABC transport system permease protein